MGDRIVVMNQGTIQQIADPLNLYHSPANRFVAGFIGSPPMNFVQGSLEEESGDLAFKSNGFSLKIPEQMQKPLQQHGATEVTFGIRPEDILARDIPHDAAADSNVEVVEPLGSEVILYLMVGEQTLVGKVDSTIHPAPNTSLRIGFNMSRCHFFDAKAGQAIV